MKINKKRLIGALICSLVLAIDSFEVESFSFPRIIYRNGKEYGLLTTYGSSAVYKAPMYGDSEEITVAIYL